MRKYGKTTPDRYGIKFSLSWTPKKGAYNPFFSVGDMANVYVM